MIDNVLLMIVGALRRSLEGSLLDRHAAEERFQLDLVGGDTTWETSYSLPGEGVPPRVVAEITVDWSAWSQAAFRSWSLGEEPADDIEALLAVVVRIQRLSSAPDVASIARVLPAESVALGHEPLPRSAPTVEHLVDVDTFAPTEWAVEVAYEGSVVLDEDALTKTEVLDALVAPLGPWLASTLVRASDLPLAFRAARDGDDRL